MTGGRADGVPESVDGLPRVERPALRELFDLALSQRICVVIGAAGWGKTTAVASWARDRPTAWMRPEDHDAEATGFVRGLVEVLRPHLRPHAGEPGAGAAAMVAWLRHSLPDDLVLVVDDLQTVVPQSPVADVVADLCARAPDRLRIVLASRREPPFSLARLRGRGLVSEIHAPELAFTMAEITDLLRATIGDEPPALAARLWERTGGWPAALCGAVEMLRGVDPDQRLSALEHHLTGPGERFHGYLAEEVLGSEPAWARDLLRRLAVFGTVTSRTVDAIGIAGASGLLTELTRRGLVRRGPGGLVRWSMIGPLVDYFDHEAVLPAADRAALHVTAARECVVRGAHAEGLRHLLAAESHAACVALLVERGEALVNSGQVDVVLAASALPETYLDDPRVQRIIGQARQVRGQWAAATECFRRAGRDHDDLEPALAWRVGLLAFTQGEFTEVLSVFGRTRFAKEDTTAETRMLAMAASAHRMTGDVDGARVMIARAESAARLGGQPRALAAVHQARAMLASADADRRQAQAECRAALHIAEAADDKVQAAWIRGCHAVHMLDMGSPRQALAEARAMRGLAEQCDSSFLLAQAATTCGRALVRLGLLDEALADLQTAVDLFQRLGSRFLAWPLCGLGDLYRVRGQLVRAHAAYEEALALTEPCHDVLGQSFALVGLARIRAADDLVAARALAERAVALGEGLREVAAYLTRGWVALLEGDRGRAAADAALAGAAARRRRDDPGLAEVLTLTVLSSCDPVADSALLGEAIDIWQETGCRLEEAAARVVAARVGTAAPDIAAQLAAETLLGLGIDVGSRRAAGPLAVLSRSGPAVTIRTLGGFQVTRDGSAVPKTTWQSKKARELVKILVARRRPVPRDQLMELLWPEVDPARSGNRLSVLLSGVRDVLQPLRAEAEPLATDGNVVWLDPTQVRIDVEEFLGYAEDALDAHRRDRDDAIARLTAAAGAYTGDFLEDDPYQDWSSPLAEDVRATHIALLRVLIARLRAAHDVDGVVRYTLRLLGHDPYDEQAHLGLVDMMFAAGRLGEARRYHQIYQRRMRDIGVTPRPLPTPRRG
ncbi:BTAD domain-containing putative transcriptional regulator [Actinokineospora sp.]|uniref:BTAD domain-containing putative transcriptional regulator n=1 Tax=Actinokineospora sp. TaxID=1872133 RepID=UPI004037DAE9